MNVTEHGRRSRPRLLARVEVVVATLAIMGTLYFLVDALRDRSWSALVVAVPPGLRGLRDPRSSTQPTTAIAASLSGSGQPERARVSHGAAPKARSCRCPAHSQAMSVRRRTRYRSAGLLRGGLSPDRATVSPMADAWISDTRLSYDTDASGYAEKVRGLLGGKPYLRASLALFAELVHGAGGGPVADVGCGPGYVTGHLHDVGVDVFGIDLSPEMIAIARRDYPDLRFEVGTMTDLDLADDSVVGIIAFWSVIHVPDHAIPGVFEQFRRVLRPQGLLLVGFHVGDEIRHTSEGYTGRPINVDSHHRRPSKLSGWLRDAGFTIEAELVIGLDEDVPGAVIFARSDG